MISLDLAARRVLMSAYLYYRFGYSAMSDAEFDEMCLRLVGDWDNLSRQRQWELGEDPIDLASTAHHVRISSQCAGSAEAWRAHQLGEKDYSYGFEFEGSSFNEDFKFHWITVAG